MKFRVNKLWIFPFLAILVLFCKIDCKKNPTTPDVQDLTRPVIWVDSYELVFIATATGPNPSSQVLKVKNSGQRTLNYTLSTEASWLSLTPPSGSSSGQIIEHLVSVDKKDLEATDEEYSTEIIISCEEAYNNPQTVRVRLRISKEPPPKIHVEPKSLSFNAQQGESNPQFQTIKIRNSGGGTLKYEIGCDVPWLDVNPKSNSSKDSEKIHKVFVDITGLKAGNYKGKITIEDSNANNSPQVVEVSLSISKEPPPVISTDVKKLSFKAVAGGQSPSPKPFIVFNSGGGRLDYTISWDASWLTVTPRKGQSSGEDNNHAVSIDIEGLAPGAHNSSIIISDPNASNNPQIIIVTLNLSGPLTDNEIFLSLNPSSGQTGAIVTVTISIKGNVSQIAAFGLDLNYNPSMFQFQSVNKGQLTSSWAAVDGHDPNNSGTVTIGGFVGSGKSISPGSSGSIAIIKFKVICATCNDGVKSQICFTNLTDDIRDLVVTTSCRIFTYKK